MLSDRNPVFILNADETHPFPEWVKEASWPSPEEVSGFAASAFADKEREYPVHTKCAAFLSCVYAFGEREKIATDPEFAARLEEAAAFWEIDPSVLDPYRPTHEKVAAEITEAPEYALVFEDDDGIQRGWLKVSNSAEITESAALLRRTMCDNRVSSPYSPGQIKQACAVLVDAADAHGLTVDPVIHNVAKRAVSNADAVHYAGLRKLAGASDDIIGIYKEAAAVADQENIESVIEAWKVLDATVGVKYATALPSPWEVFFCGPTEEEAIKVANSNVFVSEVAIPSPVVAALPPLKVDALFSLADAEIIKQASACAILNAPEASRTLARLDDHASHHLLALLATV